MNLLNVYLLRVGNNHFVLSNVRGKAMQILSVPPPIITNALHQDAAAKAVPHVQAAAPLIQNAVAPPPKSEKFNQTRSGKDRDKGGDPDEDRPESDDKDDNKKEGENGNTINIRV